LQPLVEQNSVLPWFKDLVEVERRATEIRIYETYVIPGLLQTEDYARHVVSATRPVLTDEDVERAVALRMTRQEALYREDETPRLWVIIDESDRRPNVVVQVIPNSEGSTAAGGRNFILLTLKAEPAVAYLEDIRSALSDTKSTALIKEAAKTYE